MAIYWPILAGNWSTLSNWASSDGIVSGVAGDFPSSADNVYTNNRALTLNMNASARSISTGPYFLPFGTIASGGSVTFGARGLSLTVPTISAVSTSSAAIFVGSIASPAVINGNIFAVGSTGISFGGFGSLTVNGNIAASPTTANARGLDRSESGSFSILTINGNISGGGTSGARGIQISCERFTINGNIHGGSFDSGAWIAGSFESYINGNVYGGTGGNGIIILGNPTGRFVINGNVYGGSGGTGIGGFGSSYWDILINGDVYGGSGGAAHGLGGNIGGGGSPLSYLYTVTGSIYAGSAGNGVNVGAGLLLYANKVFGNNFGRGSTGFSAAYAINNSSIYGLPFIKELYSGIRGALPTLGNIYLTRDSNNSASLFSILSADSPRLSSLFVPFPNINWVRAVSSDSNYSSVLSGITGLNFLYTAISGNNTLTPSTSNVRLRESFDFSTKTGTLIIPNIFTVKKDIPVDNSVGQAIFDPSLVWVSPLTGSGPSGFTRDSLGYKIGKSLTIESTGDIAVTYK